MNAIVAQLKTAWQVVQAEPALLVFAALVIAAVLLVVLLLALPTKKPAATEQEIHPRPRLVHDLARKGKSTAEIARKTGLARDAIALAVSVAPEAKRQSRPRAARTAGQREETARSRNPVLASYPMSVQRVR